VYLFCNVLLNDIIIYKYRFKDIYILDFELAKAIYIFNRLDYNIYAIVNLDKNNIIAINL